MNPKKILILTPYTNGYLEYPYSYLKNKGYDVKLFYISIPYKYKNILHKIVNIYYKLVHKSSLRKIHRDKVIKQELKNEKFDSILCVRGEFLNKDSHEFIRQKTNDYIAYFYDGLERVPRQKEIIPYCDRFFTYEKKDANKLNYNFITNFIPSMNYKSNEYKYHFYFIGSYDKRFYDLKKILDYLDENNYSYKAKIKSKRKRDDSRIEYFQDNIPIQTIFEESKHAKIIIDLQRRNEQSGLTFRVFEAIGNEKKILTTNKDITSYDFYDTNNILYIDPEKNINIPKEFVESNFKPIDEKIVYKYTLENWCNTIFNLK
ncbi:MAG: hypothetical protein H6604_08405 [Flavobacteriales bacterium]|nr:hypothetical protein [Flavobacteriales bacterium]